MMDTKWDFNVCIYILIDCTKTVDILNRYVFMGFGDDSFLISIDRLGHKQK